MEIANTMEAIGPNSGILLPDVPVIFPAISAVLLVNSNVVFAVLAALPYVTSIS